MTAAETVSLRRVIDRRSVILFGLGSTFAVGLVAAAILANRPAAIRHMPALLLHAPQLWRIADAPLAVQVHLAGIGVALAIGVALMVGVKGTRAHRILGWTWVLAMMTGAVSSLFIRMLNHGSLSYIHLLSGWTMIALPMGVAFARRHKVKLHATTMTWLFTGGLVIAGGLAFLPGRLMWNLFLG